MQPFEFSRVTDGAGALAAFRSGSDQGNPAGASVAYLAGGTTLIDLMKLSVMAPRNVVDINGLGNTSHGRVEIGNASFRLGALARMSQIADHEDIRRDAPVITESLQLAASAQLRNMASLGGNVLQRTRCSYFRDISYACNKRSAGSGCAALDGVNRTHAVLGTSDQCIATYAGDFAQALIALDADVETQGHRGARTFPFARLHKPPGTSPQVETTLEPGELILAFRIPRAPWLRRSKYLKIRDRESYEFALASAAVALDLADDSTVRQCRIALGGVATVPWRAHAAERILTGEKLTDASLRDAAEEAFRDAHPREHNAYKISLGKRTLIRALRETAAMEI